MELRDWRDALAILILSAIIVAVAPFVWAGTLVRAAFEPRLDLGSDDR